MRMLFSIAGVPKNRPSRVLTIQHKVFHRAGSHSPGIRGFSERDRHLDKSVLNTPVSASLECGHRLSVMDSRADVFTASISAGSEKCERSFRLTDCGSSNRANSIHYSLHSDKRPSLDFVSTNRYRAQAGRHDNLPARNKQTSCLFARF